MERTPQWDYASAKTVPDIFEQHKAWVVDYPSGYDPKTGLPKPTTAK